MTYDSPDAGARKLRNLCALAYMVSYITRVNFGAAVLAISQETGYSYSQLAVALTGAFITYGIGQLFSGYFGDRIQPRKLVALGLFSTAFMNAVLPFCRLPWQMAAVWCINGFAQSMLWPPIVRLMVSRMPETVYNRSIVVVGWASSVGTILVYLLVPLLLKIRGWQVVFVVCASAALVMGVLWLRLCPAVSAQVIREKKQAAAASFLTPVLVLVMVAIVMMGILRDSVTTWMPTYISDTFSLGTGVSILTGVVLPLFSMLCVYTASRIYRLRYDNPLISAGGMFSMGTAAALLLWLFHGKNPALAVLCLAVLTGCMHGVNTMLISMVPAFYKYTGNISTVSGVLNACTYVGSAVSTYGVARISEVSGWNTTLLVWLLVSVAGTAICLVCIRPWNRLFPASDRES